MIRVGDFLLVWYYIESGDVKNMRRVVQTDLKNFKYWIWYKQ